MTAVSWVVRGFWQSHRTLLQENSQCAKTDIWVVLIDPGTIDCWPIKTVPNLEKKKMSLLTTAQLELLKFAH
jgi:hypothetical protein